MPLTIKLTKPISIHKEGEGAAEISEITFRDPSADDFFECGLPGRQIQNFDSSQKLISIEVIVDPKAIKLWALKLSDPRRSGSELGQMAVYDLQQFWNWLGAEINPSGN